MMDGANSVVVVRGGTHVTCLKVASGSSATEMGPIVPSKITTGSATATLRGRNCGTGNDGLAMGPTGAAPETASATVATAGRPESGAIMKREANAAIVQEVVLAAIKCLPNPLGE